VAFAVTTVRGFDRLTELHARERQQKDNLCGAFWGALVLQAAGFTELDGEPLDQDRVAYEIGSRMPQGDPYDYVPPGATPRNDYRLPLRTTPDERASGTAAERLGMGIERLSGGALASISLTSEWDGELVLALLEAAAATEAELLANVRTGHFWGSRPDAKTVLDHLAGRPVAPPPADWDVGHFVSLAASVVGPRRSLIVVRDTYPTLGWSGYHVQPPEVVAKALARGDGREGGILWICALERAASVRGRLEAAGYELRYWDNGTPDTEGEE
jgi:hypothetical protein